MPGSTGSEIDKDPPRAWSPHPPARAPAWSSRQQIPLLRGVPRLQRGVPAGRPRYSVEFRGFSVEFPPTDPATAWSSAASAWSSRQQIPLQRGVPRLQRGVPANRPATAWSSAASAWSSRQQIPLQRGVPRLQRGVPANRPRYCVEFRGFSVEFTPADPARAWSPHPPVKRQIKLGHRRQIKLGHPEGSGTFIALSLAGSPLCARRRRRGRWGSPEASAATTSRTAGAEPSDPAGRRGTSTGTSARRVRRTF